MDLVADDVLDTTDAAALVVEGDSTVYSFEGDCADEVRLEPNAGTSYAFYFPETRASATPTATADSST